MVSVSGDCLASIFIQYHNPSEATANPASVSWECLIHVQYCNHLQNNLTAMASVSWGCLVSIWSYTAIVFSTRLQQRPLFLGILPVLYFNLFQYEATATVSVSWDCLVSAWGLESVKSLGPELFFPTFSEKVKI